MKGKKTLVFVIYCNYDAFRNNISLEKLLLYISSNNNYTKKAVLYSLFLLLLILMF